MIVLADRNFDGLVLSTYFIIANASSIVISEEQGRPPKKAKLRHPQIAVGSGSYTLD